MIETTTGTRGEAYTGVSPNGWDDLCDCDMRCPKCGKKRRMFQGGPTWTGNTKNEPAWYENTAALRMQA